MLASERSLDAITQKSLDAGRTLCDATHGAFLYSTHTNTNLLRKVSGEGFGPFPGSATFDELHRTFDPNKNQRGTVRIRETENSKEFPFSHLPTPRSGMAVAVRCPGRGLLGVMVYGHPEPGVFDDACEEFLNILAAQAASAIENFRLGVDLSEEITIADSARALQRKTEERLRQALDAAQLGTWTWDRNTDMLDLDDRAAHLFGVKPGERITRTELRERIVVPEHLHQTIDKLQQSLQNRSNYFAEYRIDSASGQQTWVSSIGVPNFAPGSTEIMGMVGTAQDITTRKLHEETLRESEKLAATGRLAATIAHEINNPLEAITNLIYLARTDPAVPEPVQELLLTADSELARVSQIAQQTLGFYRDTTRPVHINMSDLLISIADLFTRKMRSKDVACTVDLQRDFHVFGLQGEIRQVFSNLVVNAIDASSHTPIHIRSRKISQNGIKGISVIIQDHGSGIPSAVREKLFSAFITTKQSTGTGLGLWVTRGIVEKQGGSIRFRSTTKQPSGTIFRVFLPVNAR
jgi:PAS domain S-box-containing protein